jgi:hypothetical protein
VLLCEGFSSGIERLRPGLTVVAVE